MGRFCKIYSDNRKAENVVSFKARLNYNTSFETIEALKESLSSLSQRMAVPKPMHNPIELHPEALLAYLVEWNESKDGKWPYPIDFKHEESEWIEKVFELLDYMHCQINAIQRVADIAEYRHPSKALIKLLEQIFGVDIKSEPPITKQVFRAAASSKGALKNILDSRLKRIQALREEIEDLI